MLHTFPCSLKRPLPIRYTIIRFISGHFYSVSLTTQLVFMQVPYCFSYYSFTVCFLVRRVHVTNISQTSDPPPKEKGPCAPSVPDIPSDSKNCEPSSCPTQAHHLNRHSFVRVSLAGSIRAFGGVAALWGERGAFGRPTQLVEIQWRTRGWYFEIQAFAEVSFGCHLLGGLVQEIAGGRPHTLIHLPRVGRARKN